MPAHWTYCNFAEDSDLEQGDILLPSKELKALFSQVHAHFCSEKYLGFMVASQSCDLVRRKDSPKAGYISLAVIRPLSQVLWKLVSNVAVPLGPGRFAASKKGEVKQLFERLFNQNEQAIGLFFLNQDADLGIGEPAVAMLRVTVALKSEHYALLTRSRTGRLTPEFQAKLGWLLGNLYNRPATPDWLDMPGGKEKVAQLLAQFVDCCGEGQIGVGLTWIDDVLLKPATAAGVAIDTALLEELEQHRPRPAFERAIEEIRRELQKVAPDLPEETREKLQKRLMNNGRFKKLFPKVG